MLYTQVFGNMKHTLFIGKNRHGTLGDVNFILIEGKLLIYTLVLSSYHRL